MLDKYNESQDGDVALREADKRGPIGGETKEKL